MNVDSNENLQAAFTYSLKYKYRFVAGIFFAVLTALINASSITVLIPLFDALFRKKKTNFHLDLTVPEFNILVKEKCSVEIL